VGWSIEEEKTEGGGAGRWWPGWFYRPAVAPLFHVDWTRSRSTRSEKYLGPGGRASLSARGPRASQAPSDILFSTMATLLACWLLRDFAFWIMMAHTVISTCSFHASSDGTLETSTGVSLP
jgi:hypothetical protein